MACCGSMHGFCYGRSRRIGEAAIATFGRDVLVWVGTSFGYVY